MVRTSPWRRKSRFTGNGSQVQDNVCSPPLLVSCQMIIVFAAVSAERSTPAGSVVEPLSAATASPVTAPVSVSPMSWSITVKVPEISVMSCACASTCSTTVVSAAAPVITGASLVPLIVMVSGWLPTWPDPSSTCAV